MDGCIIMQQHDVCSSSVWSECMAGGKQFVGAFAADAHPQAAGVGAEWQIPEHPSHVCVQQPCYLQQSAYANCTMQ